MTRREKQMQEALRRVLRLKTGRARLPKGTVIELDRSDWEHSSGGYERGVIVYRYEIPGELLR